MLRKNDRPWRGVIGLDTAMDRRTQRPRKQGVTMVIDTGLGHTAMADILEYATPYIDHWKLGFGTSALMPAKSLQRKLELLEASNVLTYPGGTLLEAAIVQQHCRVSMKRARKLGFGAVEISDGTIELTEDRRKRVINCALDAGLVAVTEVGKKNPDQQPSPAELADQALRDLENGASWVIIEARESGKGIGIFDKDGEVRNSFLEDIAEQVGPAGDRLIWEAPQKAQQAMLINRFGPNANLGNVTASETLALEALRAGLRYETLAPIENEKKMSGKWSPDVPETEEMTEPPVSLSGGTTIYG